MYKKATEVSKHERLCSTQLSSHISHLSIAIVNENIYCTARAYVILLYCGVKKAISKESLQEQQKLSTLFQSEAIPCNFKFSM